jgi:hypothetical protein
VRRRCRSDRPGLRAAGDGCAVANQLRTVRSEGASRQALVFDQRAPTNERLRYLFICILTTGRCLAPIFGHWYFPWPNDRPDSVRLICPAAERSARDGPARAAKGDQRIGGGRLGCAKSLGGKELARCLTVSRHHNTFREVVPDLLPMVGVTTHDGASAARHAVDPSASGRSHQEKDSRPL